MLLPLYLLQLVARTAVHVMVNAPWRMVNIVAIALKAGQALTALCHWRPTARTISIMMEVQYSIVYIHTHIHTLIYIPEPEMYKVCTQKDYKANYCKKNRNKNKKKNLYARHVI